MKCALFVAIFVCGLAAAAQAQHIPSYTADKLIGRAAGKDTTYIINFWATWCAPCVAELPQFVELQRHYADQKVKVLLVSFDFPESYPEKLSLYIKKKKLEPEVVWFSESNANEFIPKIDASWSGALPGTMIINNSARYKLFMEKTVSAQEVIRIVDGIKK